jgi:hypothetical protein
MRVEMFNLEMLHNQKRDLPVQKVVFTADTGVEITTEKLFNSDRGSRAYSYVNATERFPNGAIRRNEMRWVRSEVKVGDPLELVATDGSYVPDSCGRIIAINLVSRRTSFETHCRSDSFWVDTMEGSHVRCIWSEKNENGKPVLVVKGVVGGIGVYGRYLIADLSIKSQQSISLTPAQGEVGGSITLTVDNMWQFPQEKTFEQFIGIA